ncbi:poly (ADP-ribose) polymerase, putative [Bodo saltans]|uniref:Poly (ADP-ribose) polymerase, putative n=1 Tax=Bodo saltans TaxID=75058 RepID=A0A0S4JKW7_BODSA|nr:poly (ADP-ribose) polymerase, putative [Bodo saltans]|eukprot:CUG89635.1 poly (ADP-ribose) polymerase, putative [Bodo saltans]
MHLTALQRLFYNFFNLPHVSDTIPFLQWSQIPQQLHNASTPLCNELLLSEDITGIPDLWAFVKDVLRSPDFEKHYTISRAVLVKHTDEMAIQAFLYLHEQECKSNSFVYSNFLDSSNPDGVAAHAKFMSLCEKTTTGHLTMAWHGVDNTNDHVFHICRDGLRGTSDAYFGKGSYVTPEAAYAAKYSDYGDDDECAVILCVVSATQVYPVTVKEDYRTLDEEALVEENVRGFSKYFSRDREHPIALKPFSNAHFIPVKEYGNIHPRNRNLLGVEVHHQATSESDAEFHELVVASHHQILPIAIVYYLKTAT